MEDSLEVQVLRNALATEQRRNGLLVVRLAELSATLASTDFQLHNVTVSATALVKSLRLQVERLRNELAARN